MQWKEGERGGEAYTRDKIVQLIENASHQIQYHTYNVTINNILLDNRKHFGPKAH